MRERRKEKRRQQQQQTRSGCGLQSVVHPVSNKCCVFFSTLYMQQQQLQLMMNECGKWVISATAFAFAFAFGWWLKNRFGTFFFPPFALVV
jgi:hypothetical protein